MPGMASMPGMPGCRVMARSTGYSGMLRKIEMF